MILHCFEKTIRYAKCKRGTFIWMMLSITMMQLHGQQLFFDQFSVSEGLAQSNVHKVIQDTNDVFWLGTDAGVSRFDGLSFTNLSVENGLAANGVRAISEDGHGNIWFGHTGGGVSRYNGQTFEVFMSPEISLNSDVTSILLDSAGHLWLTTFGSGVIEVMNPYAPLEELEFHQHSGRELSDRVVGGYVDGAGKIYFVADINVKYYNRDSARFDNVQMKGIPQYYVTTSLLVDSRGSMWFGKHNGGLYRYDPDRDDAEMYDLIESGLTSNWISTIFEDKGGNIWAGTWGGGMVRISPENKMDLFSDRNGLPGLKIRTIMQDKEGNILVGTQENGLCVYKGDHFTSYFTKDGLIDSQVWSIQQTTDGDFWFGTEGGISILQKNPVGEQFTAFNQLKGLSIGFLKEDQNGTMWIGSFESVHSYDKSGRLYADPFINSNINELNQVEAMDVDGDNNLWLGTTDGIIFFEIDTRKSTRLSQEDGLAGNEISSIFADSKNHIWVGSRGTGITVIKGSTFEQLDLGFTITPICFTEDQDGHIWIGTEAKGLIQYDPVQQKVIRTFSSEEGLLANLVNQISCDRFNNVYVGTNKGLNKYVRNEDKIYAYTERSGFVGIETKQNASYVDRDGNIWFGTVKGVTRYNPSEESVAKEEPLTHITSIQVNHEEFPIEDGLSLSHKQNSIIFEYRCITLNPDAVQYRIMLEGVDLDWREPNTETRTTYAALSHGTYSFLVKAKSSAGVWNEEPVSLNFVIRPPFYLTWYFILASIFVAGLVIFTYVKIRERTLKRENAILEEKVKDRTAIVVAQKEELAQKNKDITDSIRYAKRIQFAILPEKSPFPDTFILFKPKDIVSGDFYWFTEMGDKEFFSAVDCTGHGVPGAFMSIIGHNSLTKIVREYGILEPGKILSQLNKEVIKTLHERSDGDVYDGMDLALVSYDKKEGTLEYAGAFNPLYLVRDNEILETKADKVSIGRSSLNLEVEFTNHRIEIKKGDNIYLFSDGYADQFGGELMKKFKYKNLKELILKIQSETMDSQRTIMDQTIEQWRGDVEQVDDILVIGRSF